MDFFQKGFWAISCEQRMRGKSRGKISGKESRGSKESVKDPFCEDVVFVHELAWHVCYSNASLAPSSDSRPVPAKPSPKKRAHNEYN